MFGGLRRQAERIAKIRWAAQVVKTPGHVLEDSTLKGLRAMPRRTNPQDDQEMAAIVSHLQAKRLQPQPQSTRRDRFDGVTIDITPNP